MRWSPTRREFLGAAGGLAPASAGIATWENATDAVPDNPFVPEAEVRWSAEVGDLAIPVAVTDDLLVVVTGSAVVGLSTDGSERWRFAVEDTGHHPEDRPQAAVVSGRVFVSTREEIRALDVETGALQWRFDRTATPFVYRFATDPVLVRDHDEIVAVSPADGSERWRFSAPVGHVWNVDQFDGGRVYVGTTEGGFYALSPRDGSVQWSTRFSESDETEYITEFPHVSPAGATGDRVFVWNASEATLRAFDTSGAARWRVETSEEEQYRLPGTVDDDAIYLREGNALRAISTDDGSERWRVTVDGEPNSYLRRIGDTVYVGGVGSLAAVSTDGRERWRFTTGSDAATYPAGVNDGTVFVDHREDGVYGLDASDGTLRWRFDYPDDPTWLPQVADGAAFLGTDAGTVFALTDPGSTPLYDAYRTATSTAGLAVGGLLGGALAVGAYRRRRRRNRDGPDSHSDSSGTTTFADYELLGTVTETEFAEVHDARAPDGIEVALQRVAADELSADRFTDAVETWADLDHEGVLEVRAWGTDPTPWVATEYADASLADRAETLSAPEIARAVADAAETVHRAHRDGVGHGRLAPEHVLFVGDEVRVADWRLAAELRGSFEEVDIYRLAAMVRDLVGDERTNEDLNDVLCRALADDSADRYDSALKFADALRWAVRER